MSTLAEQVVEQLKTDMNNVYDVGYQKGVSETDGYGVGYNDGQADFGIPNEVKGTNIVTCDYVNENEHNVEVKLSSDTVTDFSGCVVKVVETNLLDYMQVVDNYRNKNYVQLTSGYIVTSLQFKPNTEYYIKVNGMRSTWATFLISTQENVNGSTEKGVGISNTWDSEKCVTTDETGLIYFGISHPVDNELEQIEQTLQEALVQIEVGIVSTPYEPYTEKTYTANADGTVEGITSILPVMSIICDGVDISAKYYCVQDVEWHRFWDLYQDYGKRNHYMYAFAGKGWNDENYKPKYPILIGTGGQAVFQQSMLKKIDMQNIEITLAGSLYGLFLDSTIEEILNMRCPNIRQLSSAFQNTQYLHTLQIYDINPQCTFSTTFNYAIVLKNLDITGEIGNSINLQWSPLLSDTSVQNIIDCLIDLTGQTTQTLTLHADVKAKLTDEQIATITSKNWTLA